LVNKNHSYCALILECLMETYFMHSSFVDIENNEDDFEKENNGGGGGEGGESPQDQEPDHTSTVTDKDKGLRKYDVDDTVLEFYNQAINVIKFHLSEDHLYYINILSKLSELYIKCEEYEKGYEIQKECLDYSYKLLGKNHHLTGKHVSKVR